MDETQQDELDEQGEQGEQYELCEYEAGYSFADRLADVLSSAFAAPANVIIGLINCIQHGDWWGNRDAWFLIPLCEEWPAGAIPGILRQRSIDVYGYGCTFERQYVIVDRADYWRVIEVFDAYGVTYQAEDIRGR